MESKISSDLIRGHVDTIILKLLSEQNMYGYQISKEILERSNNVYELKEASLYSSVKRLEKDQCIEAYWGEESQGGRRKYYKLTASGKEQLEINLNNWQIAKQIIDLLLKEK